MKFYQSILLNKYTNISHKFTTKDGGLSSLPYNSLNLAFHVGDNEVDVLKNHQILADELDYNFEKLTHMKQIHSSIVYTVEEKDLFHLPPTCDALITNKKNRPLMVMVADCSPILFYDKKGEVIAVAHAGREGAFKNIVQNVLDKFHNDYNSNIKDILVSVGPSIKECCYEVGIEIFQEAKEYDLEYSIIIKENRYYLNISKILLTQLLSAGIKKENIEISTECSCCKSSQYYSYRAQNKTGRFAGIIYLT